MRDVLGLTSLHLLSIVGIVRTVSRLFESTIRTAPNSSDKLKAVKCVAYLALC